MFGKILITHQTGPLGKKVKRLYIEEASEIQKEFYLSCLVDRASSKIAFISSTEGGVEIEKVAQQNPEKIITTKFELKDEIADRDFENIIKVFKLDSKQRNQAKKLINSIFNLLFFLILIYGCNNTTNKDTEDQITGPVSEPGSAVSTRPVVLREFILTGSVKNTTGNIRGFVNMKINET